MRIGPLTLPSNLFLSPLAGYTNLPFRLVVREIGGVGLCTTDLVNARSLLEKTKAFKLIETRPADRPLAVQIFGADAREMADAAPLLEDCGVASVDINMGCPVHKVVQCRRRLGHDDRNSAQPPHSSARMVERGPKFPSRSRCGSAGTTHNLTAPTWRASSSMPASPPSSSMAARASRASRGTVNLDGIRPSSRRSTPSRHRQRRRHHAAGGEKMLDETGCAGVAAAAHFTDPWIFQRTVHYLDAGGLPPRPAMAGAGGTARPTQILQRVLENPRIVKRAAADAHAGAAGFVEHLLRGLRRDDVAVADDGNVFHGFDDLADAGEIHRAAETLLARPAMNENRGDAGVLQRARQIRRGQIVVVPAEPHLGGDGNFHGVDHAADERGGFVQFGHHGRAAADVADLADGTAHVDVHGRERRAIRACAPRRAFPPGTEPKSWTASGESAGRVSISLNAFGIFLEQRAGVDQVGGAEADAADFAHDEPEGQVGVTRQRREKQIGLQASASRCALASL